MIEIRAETDPMIEYLHGVKGKFHTMVNTMKSVAKLIELETVPYVPLDTSALEQSYEYKIYPHGNYILMEVGYDAEDEETGFHYAFYQHENRLHHPKRGVDHYLTIGIMDSRFEVFELIETDYLSLFTGSVMVNGVNRADSVAILNFGDDI